MSLCDARAPKNTFYWWNNRTSCNVILLLFNAVHILADLIDTKVLPHAHSHPIARIQSNCMYACSQCKIGLLLFSLCHVHWIAEHISMASSIPYFARWSCEPTSNYNFYCRQICKNWQIYLYYYYRLKYRDRDSLIVKTISYNYIVFNSVDASVDKNRHFKWPLIGWPAKCLMRYIWSEQRKCLEEILRSKLLRHHVIRNVSVEFWKFIICVHPSIA